MKAFKKMAQNYGVFFSILILGYSFVTLNAVLACTIIGFGFLTILVPMFFRKC